MLPGGIALVHLAASLDGWWTPPLPFRAFAPGVAALSPFAVAQGVGDSPSLESGDSWPLVRLPLAVRRPAPGSRALETVQVAPASGSCCFPRLFKLQPGRRCCSLCAGPGRATPSQALWPDFDGRRPARNRSDSRGNANQSPPSHRPRMVSSCAWRLDACLHTTTRHLARTPSTLQVMLQVLKPGLLPHGQMYRIAKAIQPRFTVH